MFIEVSDNNKKGHASQSLYGMCHAFHVERLFRVELLTTSGAFSDWATLLSNLSVSE